MIHSWIDDELADARAKMAEALGRGANGRRAYDFYRGRQQALVDVRSALVDSAGDPS